MMPTPFRPRIPQVTTAGDVVAAAQLACLLEASAPKPGNVSPGRHFRDTRYEDFLASAAAIGPALSRAGSQPIGLTIREAVEAAARWTRSNTNLGIVLLLVPLVKAAIDSLDLSASAEAGPPSAGLSAADLEGLSPDTRIRRRLRALLECTTVEDARQVYAAIRLASPGGLGRADAQDVAHEPTATLLEVMRLAAARDAIAREYATGYDITFTAGAPALRKALRDGLPWEAAVVEGFLTLLAALPDTHIVRRGGPARAAEVSRLASDVLAKGGVRTDVGRRAIARMDDLLRDDRHIANPGTTADLTAASIFVVMVGGET